LDIAIYAGMFIVSLIVLLKGSDWFIDSAEEIGLSLGISPFVIGVTIVAFGTSLPELATSIAAVWGNDTDSGIVIGNVVGSNVTNIALVLGLVAISVKQIDLEYNIWHIDMPYLWGSAFLLWFVARDGSISLFEAILFMGGIVIFLGYSFGNDDDDKEKTEKAGMKAYGLLLLGGILVWLGATYTVVAITELSLIAGISPETIALTVVALGTSLPEVIVSLNAARKGNTSMAVGNVLGSNIFNTFIVIAIPAMVGNLYIPPNVLSFSLPFMIVMTIMFGITSNNKKITNWEGVLLIMFYVYFMVETYLLGTA